MYSHRQK